MLFAALLALSSLVVAPALTGAKDDSPLTAVSDQRPPDGKHAVHHPSAGSTE